ncbi:MAG: FHA domain-containing protein [bacterium]
MIKILLKFRNNVMQEIKTSDLPITIGRSKDNVVCIDNLGVSKHHAMITQKKDIYLIEDLYSTNGTFLNEKLIHCEQLKNGDEIIIGKHTLEIFIEEGDMSHHPVNLENIEMDKTMVLETKKQKKMLAKLRK